VRLYDHLFRVPDPSDVPEGGNWLDQLNPSSLETLPSCYLEPSLKETAPGAFFQLERLGYFIVDRDSTSERVVLNRSVTLRDTWAKIEKQQQQQKQKQPQAKKKGR